jgi:hypothetical protein
MSSNQHPARIAIGAALIALAACAALWQTAESQRAARLDDAARATAKIEAAAAVVAQRTTLEVQRARLRASLGSVLLHVDATARVASFVRDVAHISMRHRTTIAAIVPQVTPGAATIAAGARVAPTTPQEAFTFEVTVEGAYIDVLATVGDLASLTYPAGVSLTSIARTNPHAAEATVSAAIRVTLDAPTGGDPA